MRTREKGFTLLEALVAIAILAISLLGLCAIRTDAVVSATKTRNLRLARELAERTLSEIEAGTMELLDSGIEKPFERYPTFRYKILVGDSAVETEAADAASAADIQTGAGNLERVQWQQDRDRERRQQREKIAGTAEKDPLDAIKEDTTPTEKELETVAVVILYPAVGDEDNATGVSRLVLRTKISSLALSGLTPEQAEAKAKSAGLTTKDPAAGGEK
jgi:prepilin-type N-terminal cleavage/methylation domain-containing protein